MAAARKREADPPTQLRTLIESLQKGPLPRAALLRGEERYFIDRALEELLARAKDAGLEVCKHDVADPEFVAANLLDDLGANPMFASARFILVRNADTTRVGQSSIMNKQGTKTSPFTRAVISFVESNREGAVVITGRSIRADHAIAKAIKAKSLPVLSLRALYDTPPPWAPDPRKSELALWVGTRSRQLGMRVSPDDCAYIAGATGNDLAAIDTQLEKVRVGGKQAIQESVQWQSGGTPWKAADDLLSGHLARALASLESLYRSGFHSSRDGKTEVSGAALGAMLMGTLRSKSRQAALVSRAVASGASMAQAAAEAGVKGKPAMDSLGALLKLRSAQDWERFYREVLELERKSRSGPEVDMNDFVALALRHSPKPNDRRQPAGAGHQQRR
jgi:DNA polymerase III delta subunit